VQATGTSVGAASRTTSPQAATESATLIRTLR
jgi:hypothetical protein